MFNYYSYNGRLMFSKKKYADFKEISEKDAVKFKGLIYYLISLPPETSRRSFCVSSASLFHLCKEDLNLIQENYNKDHIALPKWLTNKVELREIMAINMEYPTWRNCLEFTPLEKWKINLVGTGDVGGILATGLRLLGGNKISEIGLYGKDINCNKRWEAEINQILPPNMDIRLPKVSILPEENLFDCNLFIFCASAGVPPIGSEKMDVRLVQWEGNSKIIAEYAKMARTSKYKGIFAVVSDPVDLLCKSVFLASNSNSNGELDFQGIAPEQIRGYGLGVMHARATYYSQQDESTKHYISEGRAFGPHGEGLVIADSILNYSDSLSQKLTDLTKKANLEIRSTGFKPYIAPALSSGTLSILATIQGEWHYSATFMGGVYMGARNRLLDSGTEIEQFNLPSVLWKRLSDTYKELEKF